MTFENTLYDVNTKMEKRAFDEETCKISLFEREKQVELKENDKKKLK